MDCILNCGRAAQYASWFCSVDQPTWDASNEKIAVSEPFVALDSNLRLALALALFIVRNQKGNPK